MDILGTFDDAIISRFDADAVLSAGVAAKVYKADSDTQTEEEHLVEINNRLNDTGVVGTLSSLRMERVEGDFFVYRGGLFWEVNKKKNLSSTGCQKSGRVIFQKSLELLHRYKVSALNEGGVSYKPFSQILISMGERIGEDSGVELWMIEFETKLAIAITE